MNMTREYLLASSDDPQCTAALYNATTLNVMHSYKNGGMLVPNSMSLLGGDYFLGLDQSKPIMHAWPLNSQEPSKQLSSLLAEKAQALALCPRNYLLAMGLGSKLFTWNINSGKLLSILQPFYQEIVRMQWAGDYLAIAGKDGTLVVYDYVSLIHGNNTQVFKKHDHTLEITGLHVGSFNLNSRICTVSLDKKCCIYELHTGDLIQTIFFEEPLLCVLFDEPCWNLYIGTESGKVHHVQLVEPPKTLQAHAIDTKSRVLEGHSDSVTCLALDSINEHLASGSANGLVIVWKTSDGSEGHQLQLKGSVTNLRYVPDHANFTSKKSETHHVFKQLQRNLSNEPDVVSFVQKFDVQMGGNEVERLENVVGLKEEVERLHNQEAALKAEIDKLKTCNKQLKDSALKLAKKYNNFN